jgi:hypothetical protein
MASITGEPIFDLLLAFERDRPTGTLGAWLKEDPVKRSKLLLWMMEKTDGDGMEEIVTALIAAIKIKETAHDAPVRERLREAIRDYARAQGRGSA